MSILKKMILKILPLQLKEFLNFYSQQQEQVRRNEQIASKNRKKIDSLLCSSLPILLEFGAGESRGIAGWTYTDINDNCELTFDLLKPIPFPENSVSMIYSSHLLEHFNYNDLIKFLKECLFILKPGGIFSAAIPNARIYLDAYQNPNNFEPNMFCQYKSAYNNDSKIDYVNYIAFMDGHHRYMFDEENILAILKKCGFSNVRLRDFDSTLDLKVRDYESIYVSGQK